MGLLNRTRDRTAALAVQTGNRNSLPAESAVLERELYRQLRMQVPIIDAAIYKIRRLIGDFTVECADEQAGKRLAEFLALVPVNASGNGVDAFIGAYFEQLLTYGTAVGEMVVQDGKLQALYNADLQDVEIRLLSPLQTQICRREGMTSVPCAYQELLLLSALNPEPGKCEGVSVLRGLPFISEVLMRIFRTIGTNWERAGNVRFAVTCKGDESGLYGGERVKQIAKEWKRAMHSDTVSDFVALGDVNIKAIGADNQILDSEVPVRQLLEQIVAKLGLPPFLLGLSWSSTERMSSQQADILTSELEAYRRILEPTILKICRMWLTLEGFDNTCKVVWNDITMQDELDHANAQKAMAETQVLLRQLEETGEKEEPSCR